MVFLKKLTNYGLLALLTIEVFFLFSCMTQGVTFNGIVTLTKNPFYPETVNTAVVNGNFLDLFTTIVTIAFALVTCILLVRKQYKEFLNTTTLAVGVFLTIGSIFQQLLLPLFRGFCYPLFLNLSILFLFHQSNDLDSDSHKFSFQVLHF